MDAVSEGADKRRISKLLQAVRDARDGISRAAGLKMLRDEGLTNDEIALMLLDVIKRDRPRRAPLVVTMCPDPKCPVCQSEMARHVADIADYVIEVRDEQWDECRDWLIQMASTGGPELLLEV